MRERWASTLSGMRVVLVDDDADLRSIARSILEREGVEVTELNDGAALVPHLQAEDHLPDAIVLDILMPNQTGWSALAELRSTPGLTDLPVVISSSLDDADYRRARGIAAYVLKPFTPPQLLSAVRKAIFRGGDDAWTLR